MILFLIDGFYEAFNEDAYLISRLCGLRVTERQDGENTLAMVGFPVSDTKKIVSELVAAKHRIAVCEVQV